MNDTRTPRPSIFSVDGKRYLLCPERDCLVVTQGIPNTFRSDIDMGIAAMKGHLLTVHKIPEPDALRRARNASYEQRQ